MSPGDHRQQQLQDNELELQSQPSPQRRQHQHQTDTDDWSYSKSLPPHLLNDEPVDSMVSTRESLDPDTIMHSMMHEHEAFTDSDEYSPTCHSLDKGRGQATDSPAASLKDGTADDTAEISTTTPVPVASLKDGTADDSTPISLENVLPTPWS